MREGKNRGKLLAVCILGAMAVTATALLLASGGNDLPLRGRTILLAGDSRSSDDYTFYKDTLEKKTGCTAVTVGASGKTAAFNASDEYMDRVLGEKHDWSIWLVGGNDDGSPGTVGTFRAGSPLAEGGEPVVSETDISEDYDGTTFIQAVDHIMRKYRQEAAKNMKMIFCTDLPQQRDSADSPWSRRENWERKRLAILECCEKNGVDCLDLYELCAFDMTKEPMYTEPTDKVNDRGVYYMDGLHPNRRGIDRITDLEIRRILGEEKNP